MLHMIYIVSRDGKDETIVTLVNFGSWEKQLSATDIGVADLKVYVASDDSGLKTG